MSVEDHTILEGSQGFAKTEELTKKLFINPNNVSEIKKKLKIYQEQIGGLSNSNKLGRHKLQRFLSLKLLNQQFINIEPAILKSTKDKKRVYSIDPHMLRAYADCCDPKCFSGFSILGNFEDSSQESENEERIALLALLNESIDNQIPFLLLDSGVRELSSHIDRFTDENENVNQQNIDLLRNRYLQLLKDDVFGVQTQEHDIEANHLLEWLENDAKLKQFYTVFSTVSKHSAATRLQDLLNGQEGCFYSINSYPFAKLIDDEQKLSDVMEQYELGKSSRDYFEVQRVFREIYKIFVTTVFEEKGIRSIEREFDNVDALFDIHFINTILDFYQTNLQVCYLSFSPSVTYFADLFKKGETLIKVIHPRFLPIYLNQDNQDNQDAKSQSDWYEINQNINQILIAARPSDLDLLSRDDSRLAALLVDDKQLKSCYEQLIKPLKTIEKIYSVTSGEDDLRIMVANLSETFNDISKELRSQSPELSVTSEQLKSHYEAIVSRWKERARKLVERERKLLISSTIDRQLQALASQEIDFAPVIARKVEKSDDLKYVVFLPTLGAARYSFAIPYREGERWMKDLELSNEISSFKSTAKMICVFKDFLQRTQEKNTDTVFKLSKNNKVRSEIVSDLISGILCIATYHWPLAKNLFEKAKRNCEQALQSHQEDEQRNVMLSFLLQECSFFYQLAERGKIEQNYAGKKLAKHLLDTYKSISDTCQLFVKFYDEHVVESSKRFQPKYESNTGEGGNDWLPRVHPMAVRIGLSCINFLLELLDSEEAIHLVTNDSAYEALVVMGGDCKYQGKLKTEIEQFTGPLFDDLMSLSMKDAVENRPDTLEMCRNACLRAYGLLVKEFDTVERKSPHTSRLLLMHRQFKLLESAIMIDFIQQLEFYSIENSGWITGDGRVWGGNITCNDREWNERLQLFVEFSQLKNAIIRLIKEKNKDFRPRHRLADVLCCIGEILYEPNHEEKSFRRLLLSNYPGITGELKPFQFEFIGMMLFKLDEMDEHCRKMQSVGFPRRFTHKMKIIFAEKIEHFIRLMANGLKVKYLDPHKG